MAAVTLAGLAASDGIAVGRAVLLPEAPEPQAEGAGGDEEAERALGALERVAVELRREARWLRAEGLVAEAEILEANELMALDPVLAGEVRAEAAERSAAAALARATKRHADALDSLADPMLAARADDVRQIGRRASRVLLGAAALPEPVEPSVLVAADLGPADVAELQASRGRWCGIALAEGSATAHAAIMARALGLPMVVGLGPAIAGAAGRTVVLDADAGTVVVDPASTPLAHAHERVRERERRRTQAAAGRDLPCVTADGRAVTLLCNVASAADVAAGLAAGAAGAGLVRTELAFLEAESWPREAEHAAALAPLLHALADRVATVRVLDFGEDKTPPFLAGTPERGIGLLLAHEDALRAQLRAILRTGARTALRILLPLVEHADQIRAARELLEDAAAVEGWRAPLPPLGAMVETPAAAGRAGELARASEFLSIGTNDLVQYTLALDRTQPLAATTAAADPAVLRHVAAVTAAAEDAGLAVEVCGEAAAEVPLALLFVGLGVSELSASAPRLDELRAAIRTARFDDATAAARAALEAGSADEALGIARGLSGELGHERGEPVGRVGGVVA